MAPRDHKHGPRKDWHAIVVAAGSSLCMVAHAQVTAPEGADESGWSIKGFGTLGAVYHDRAGVNFRRNISQAQGAEAGRVSLAPDSMLGLQVSAQWGPQWQAAVQLASQDSLDRDYRPGVSWGYVRHAFREDAAWRVGRLGIEMYSQGDGDAVGYASLAVRPTATFYPSTMDGVDVEITRALGEGTARFKAAYGWVRGRLQSGGYNPYSLNGSRFAVVMADYAFQPWTLRVGLGQQKTRHESSTPDLERLRNALMGIPPNGPEIVERSLMRGRRINYLSASLSYDEGPVQAAANYVSWRSSGWALQHVLYGHAGYRIGKTTPYMTFQWQKARRDTVPTGIPQGLSTMGDQLNEGAALVQAASRANLWGLGLGVRHELTSRSALKLQWDHIWYRDPNYIADQALMAQSYAGRTPKRLNLLSLAWEFVF